MKTTTIIPLEDNIDLYLKAKERKNISLSKEEYEFIFEKLDNFFNEKKYDYIFIPESSKNFINSIARRYFDFDKIIIIEKKKYDNDNLVNLLIDIQSKNIDLEQKKSIIYNILEKFKKTVIDIDLEENEDLSKEITLSAHDFKSKQRKNIVEYIYDEIDIRNIRNIIFDNKDKKFCLLDDFIKTGETLNYISDKLLEYIDYIDFDIITIFKEADK